MASYHCPHCGYTVYRTEISYFEKEEYKVKEDDGTSTRIGLTEKKEYVYAIEKGKLSTYCFEKVENAFSTSGEIINSSVLKK